MRYARTFVPAALALAALLLVPLTAGRADAVPASLGFHHVPSDPVDLSRAGGNLWVRVRVYEGALAAASLQMLAAGAPQGASVAMVRQGVSAGHETWIARAPADLRRYRIELTPSAGGRFTAGPYQVPTHVPAAVPWVATSVGYQIFPDRFANGDPSNDTLALASDEASVDPHASGPTPVVLSSWSAPPPADLCCHAYYGGDLQGILDKLPYLKREGVTVLYLNPIVTAGSAHGYDASSFLQVAPHLGDLATLRRLLVRAHALGMRVLFDYVPDHTGVGFWAFQNVVRYGPDSPYWNWYVIRKWPFEPGDASAYAGWSGIASLPQLNLSDPGVERYLLEVARYWLTVGFDGLRVDAPNALVDGHGFVKTLRRTVKSVRSDTYLVGEIWTLDTSWLQGDQFDSLMNYALGRDVLLKYAKSASPLFGGRWALAQLSRIAAEIPTSVAAMGFNVIDSHDTSRSLTDLGGGDWGAVPSAMSLERQRLASALLYAMPGMPVTFQGDECAQLGQKNGDLERYPVQWGACNSAMQAHYALLGHLKATLPALASPLWLAYRGQGAVLAFFRGVQGNGRVLAAFNAGAVAADLALPAGTWTDAATGRRYRHEVALPARGWRYLVLSGAPQ
jgi:cyclomaltodextrinase / maltogenic alpha-amylase / neopullulanase